MESGSVSGCDQLLSPLWASVSLSLKCEDKLKGRGGIWLQVSPSTFNILCFLGFPMAGGGLIEQYCGRPELSPRCWQPQFPTQKLVSWEREGV